MIVARQYTAGQRSAWDRFVWASRNGTFLFLRDYMDYHADRFSDASLMFYKDDDLVALLPADRVDDVLWSHRGLTYGGFLFDGWMTTPRMLQVADACFTQLRASGCSRLHYKTMPSIYALSPAEEDRYALFRAGAELYRRDVLSVIAAEPRLPAQKRRLRSAAKAARSNVRAGESERWDAYWALLARRLAERYGRAPVHSLEEITLLRSRFPQSIRLFVAEERDELVAGVVIYESPRVAHCQYIAASPWGFEIGALDQLFLWLIEDVYRDKPFFDFGTSTEDEGRALNTGLIEQKEGFGARAVIHDFYRLDLA